MVAKIRPIHEDDERNRHLNDGKIKGNFSTIPRSVRNRDKGHGQLVKTPLQR